MSILRSGWDSFKRFMATPFGLGLIVLYFAFIAWLLNADPRNLGYRLLLMAGILALYYLPQKMWIRVLLAAIVMIVIVPIFGIRNPALLELGFQIALFAALALGLNVVVGFAGLLDLGYIAFFAVGAYVWSIYGSQQLWQLFDPPGTAKVFDTFPFPAWHFWIFLALGTLAAAGAGILLGLPVLRLRGDYLAIVTLGFGEVIRVLANNLSKPINLTGGPQGIRGIQKPFEVSEGFAQSFGDLTEWISQGTRLTAGNVYSFFFYFLALLLLVVLIVVAMRLESSKIGRSWTAIREDDVAAVAMGVPLRRTKLTAFAIGAAFAGGMGVLYASHRNFVSPETFSLTESISVLVMVILGGLGSIPGVIVGAAIVQSLEIDVLQQLSLMLSSARQGIGLIPLIGIPWSEVPAQLDPARYQRLVFGLLLIIMMIFRPEGIIPSRRAKLELHQEDDDPLGPSNPEADLPDAAFEHGTTGMLVEE